MKELKTFKQFYRYINNLRSLRKRIIKNFYKYGKINRQYAESLKSYLELIEKKQKINDKYHLLDNDNGIPVNFDYEINELKKDIFYCENSHDNFMHYLESFNNNFNEEFSGCIKFLKNFKITNFITDRDGTINNYCGRYYSSLQSVYNSLFLDNFIKNIEMPVILSSAPLKNMLDVSLNSKNILVFAGSKGREYVYKNKKGKYFIEKRKLKILEKLNRSLVSLLNEKQNEIFRFIGSGFQLKTGEITIARQDAYGSIPENKSIGLINTITGIVDQIDPGGNNLRLIDTGRDIEIVLTIEENRNSGIKDYDKGDGIGFLNKNLGLGLGKTGTNLICGDTGSDIAMLKKALEFSPDTAAIFVTVNNELKRNVLDITEKVFFVSGPDVLVSAFEYTGNNFNN